MNNIVPIQLYPLNVSASPDNQASQAYGKVTFPNLGGVYFCPQNAGYGTQSFMVGEYIDSSGSFAQFGTFTKPLKNWGLVCDTSAAENFQVYDSAGKMLFAVTGTGITKLNKIARNGATPAVAVNANAGTGGSAVMTAGGTDSAFQLTLTSGSAAIVAGTWMHVTFATPFLSAPIIVANAANAAANNAISSGIWGFVANVTTAGFDWNMAGSTGPGIAMLMNFIVIG
jgi:hypothetical protein